MDILINRLLEQTPNLAGLLLVVWILYRQNERLMADMLARIEELEKRMLREETKNNPPTLPT